jgi:hypothetical protein
MSINMTAVLETTAKRLFPDKTLEQALAQLLLERAQKNLIKYQSMSRQFEAKYNESFEDFRQRVLNSEPDFAVEQDYFDWELAITGISDMKKEIERLHDLGEQ